MKRTENGWEYSGSATQRLWEKSAIGRLIEGEKLALSDSEVIFCRDHRNIDFPYEGWLQEAISRDSTLLEEAAVLESLRVPGNKVVLRDNCERFGFEYSALTWAMRWPSDKHPSKDSPTSEIIYFRSFEAFSVGDLYNWCLEVTDSGKIAEVIVIDEEHSVVTYRLVVSEMEGQMSPPGKEDFQKIARMKNENTSFGAFFPDTKDWKFENIGIPLHGGRQLDSLETEIILGKYDDGGNLAICEELNLSASLLLDLWNRGLNTRSGFKYGTAWRCYPGNVGDGHAPWLVVDPHSKIIESSPKDWAAACLSSRLASGVNKHWVHPYYDGKSWCYLELSRPPSDSRWTNPTRK